MADQDEDRAMGDDPLASDDEVMQNFFRPAPVNGQSDLLTSPKVKPPKEKPTHYRVVSISLYNEDIERIDSLVKELKRRGQTKMNRSALIRFAIDTCDIDKLPRQY